MTSRIDERIDIRLNAFTDRMVAAMDTAVGMIGEIFMQANQAQMNEIRVIAENVRPRNQLYSSAPAQMVGQLNFQRVDETPREAETAGNSTPGQLEVSGSFLVYRTLTLKIGHHCLTNRLMLKLLCQY